jgi:glycosyltransferase involved in cell wall biosynthesis
MLGGGEHSFYDLLGHLPDSWDVISTVPKNGDLEHKLRRKKINTFVIPMPAVRPWRLTNNLACLKSYLSICKIHHPQLIYANGSRAAIYGGVVGKFLKIPVIWHCRVADTDRILDPLLTKLCDRIIVNSNATASRFGKHILPKLKVIHNGINISWFEKQQNQKNSLIDSEWKVILMVARASRWKRHDVALSSFEKIAHLDRKIHMIFIGNKDEFELEWWRHLQNMTRRSRYSNRIHWIGHIDDVRPWYRAADLLLMPSKNEPFGRVLVEAMACGVPVVAVRSGGVPEIVRHQKDGILVQNGHSHELAGALKRLLQDDAARQKMGRSGKERAKEFDLESHLKAISDAFKEAMKTKKTIGAKRAFNSRKHCG